MKAEAHWVRMVALIPVHGTELEPSFVSGLLFGKEALGRLCKEMRTAVNGQRLLWCPGGSIQGHHQRKEMGTRLGHAVLPTSSGQRLPGAAPGPAVHKRGIIP